MSDSKEDIIKEYKKLRGRIGTPPDRKAFCRESGVTVYAMNVAFGGQAFSKIKRAVGDDPNVFLKPARSRDEFFVVYGEVVRDLQGIPSEAEWLHRKIRPVANSYKKILHLRWSQMPFAFIDWASNKPAWKDVAEICRIHCENAQKDVADVSPEAGGCVYLIKSGRYYKLGRTTSMGRREYDIALQLPEPVKTVHFIKTDDPAGIETYWHKRFEDKRKQGEWFDLNQADIAAFKRRKFM